MTCPVLTLVNEVFAPPIEQVVIPKVPVAGEWGGIQVMTAADATTAIVGVNITTHLDTTVPASPTVTVTMPVAGGVTRSVIFPWAAAGSGMFAQLNAAKFTNAAFMVVKYTADPQGGAPYESRYAIFDLRPPAPGKMPPQPVVLGPFSIPAGSDEQFCPNANGQLALIWRSLNPGCVANVYRTEISFGVTSIQPLLTTNDPTALGTIACKITSNGAAGFDIALYDQAFRQGNTAVSLTANSRMLASDTIRPGHLKLSVRTLAMTVSQNSLPFTITNDGRDFLEVTGIAAMGAGFTITPMVTLPKCLLPSETLPVTVARAGTGALTDTITVTTTPAAAAGANTIAVSAAAAAPVTRVTVTPLMLSWLAGNTTAKPVAIRNAGTVAVDVAVPAPAAGSAFTWTSVPTTTLAPGASSTVSITPPAAPAAVTNGSLTVSAFVTGTMTALTGFPVSVALSAGVTARVPPGALKIATIVADPPGDDMMPEGEFIEIINVTGSPLDLTQTRIDQTVFSQQSTTGHFAALKTFGATEFGADSMLPPFANGNGPTLRILTRAKKANDVASPFRLYLGRSGPVWNNTGDTGRIVNEFGQTVDQYTYVTSVPSAGLPPGTVFSQPTARHLALVRRVYVNTQMDWTTVFTVQEGDLVNITASGKAGFGGFLGSAGTWGPDGGTELAPAGWPLPGAPKFGLIADIGGQTQMFIGSSGTITINRSGGPFVLSLGPNDNGIGDNNGDFDCVATLYR